MPRIHRHELLKALLSRSPASTQETLVAGLANEGISVTQATISRDLAAIGAVRASEGYRLPNLAGTSPASPGDPIELKSIFRDHVLRIEPAASMVVIHTAPGHANFVASEIDATKPTNMLGCIAGDDTIFIATPSIKAAAFLAEQLGQAIEVGS